MLNLARSIQIYDQAKADREDRDRRKRGEEFGKSFSSLIGSGDFKGATKAAAEYGDPDLTMQTIEFGRNQAETERTRVADRRKQTLDALSGIMPKYEAMMQPLQAADGMMQTMTNGAGSIGVDAAMMSEWQKDAPVLSQVTGIPEDELLSYQINSRTLPVYKSQMEKARKEYDFMQLDDGTFVRTDDAGGMTDLGRFAKPEEPEYQTTTVMQAGKPVQVQYEPRDPEATMRVIGRVPDKGPLVSVNTGQPELSVAQEVMERKLADTLSDWKIGGGSQAAVNLQALDGVVTALESGKDLTGGWRAWLPNDLRAVFDTQGLDTQQTVEQVVQNSLRATLGAAFTASEAEQLISRAYNPKLPEEMNAKRIRRLMQAAEARAQQLNSLDQYLLETGRLTGWDGSLKSVDSILAEMDSLSGGINTPEQQSQGFNLPRPQSKKEYEALPSGTPYIHPDGTQKVKP